jgi:hypothetical protein
MITALFRAKGAIAGRPRPKPAAPRASESVAVAVPAIGKGFTAPGTVRAGKKVVISFPVTETASAARVTPVTVLSSYPKIGGTIVKHVEKFVAMPDTPDTGVEQLASEYSVNVTVPVGDAPVTCRNVAVSPTGAIATPRPPTTDSRSSRSAATPSRPGPARR